MTGDPAGLITVVIADDEPDVRRLLEVQFGLDGRFTVVGLAADGAEALSLVGALRPDAVVMDLLMPGVNGFSAIATLQESFPEIGVVAYTGVAGDYVRAEMAARNVEVVLKSGDLRPLAQAVRRAVGR